MSLSKAQLMTAAMNELRADPATALLVEVRDPRLLKPVEAMAQMLSLLSEHIDISANEPFDKVRDATILADAAAKGVMPYARSAVVTMKATNQSGGTITINAGDEYYDAQGRLYKALATKTIGNELSGNVQLRQTESITQTHIVSEYAPFYKVAIDKPENESEYISSIMVYVDNYLFEYSKDFVNCSSDDSIYHIEIDEYQVMNIVFGWESRIGKQLNIGSVVRVEIERCGGDIDGKAGDEFTPSTNGIVDRSVHYELVSIDDKGAQPIGLDVLRELCKYPTLYNDNAVYLGSFDALIRRHYPDLKFLSVWNEQIEEKVRGANQDNINKLFVSFCTSDAVTVSQMQANVLRVIANADDGYRVQFVDYVEVSPTVTIKANISVIHDSVLVQEQIIGVMLNEYGAGTANAKRGMLSIRHKDVTKLLSEKIPALADGVSDVSVIVTEPSSVLPEHWRYLKPASLSVTVTSVLRESNTWGA